MLVVLRLSELWQRRPELAAVAAATAAVAVAAVAVVAVASGPLQLSDPRHSAVVRSLPCALLSFV